MIDYSGHPLAVEPTYMAATATTLTAPVGTKSFFVLMGSETKIVRITRIHITGPTLTTAEYNNIVLRKLSSAPSGGTSSYLTKTPTDSICAPSSLSFCGVYSVEPTTDGTLVGTIQSQRVLLENTSIGSSEQFAEILFDLKPPETSAGVILRGTSEGISLAFGSSPGSAVTLSLEVEWSEIN